MPLTSSWRANGGNADNGVRDDQLHALRLIVAEVHLTTYREGQPCQQYRAVRSKKEHHN